MSKLRVPPEMMGGESTGREFEFDEADNQTFRGLATAMRFVATIMIVFGILQALIGLVAGLTLVGILTIAQGLLVLLVGAWLATAAGSLAAIVSTEGNDILNLMYAMRKLKSVFTLQAWMLGIACALIFVSLALTIVHH